MKYPEGFVKRVKGEYTLEFDKDFLRKALDSGDDGAVEMFLGKEINVNMTILPEEIVALFDAGMEKKILDEAEEVIRRKNLYNEWLQILKSKVSEQIENI